jgi:hypothetical protein
MTHNYFGKPFCFGVYSWTEPTSGTSGMMNLAEPEALKGFYVLSAALQVVQDYGVYGKGMENDKWLLPGMEETTWIGRVKNYGTREW